MVSLSVDGGLRPARWGLILRESEKAMLTARVRYLTPSHVDKRLMLSSSFSNSRYTPLMDTEKGRLASHATVGCQPIHRELLIGRGSSYGHYGDRLSRIL